VKSIDHYKLLKRSLEEEQSSSSKGRRFSYEKRRYLLTVEQLQAHDGATVLMEDVIGERLKLEGAIRRVEVESLYKALDRIFDGSPHGIAFPLKPGLEEKKLSQQRLPKISGSKTVQLHDQHDQSVPETEKVVSIAASNYKIDGDPPDEGIQEIEAEDQEEDIYEQADVSSLGTGRAENRTEVLEYTRVSLRYSSTKDERSGEEKERYSSTKDERSGEEKERHSSTKDERSGEEKESCDDIHHTDQLDDGVENRILLHVFPKQRGSNSVSNQTASEEVYTESAISSLSSLFSPNASWFSFDKLGSSPNASWFSFDKLGSSPNASWFSFDKLGSTLASLRQRVFSLLDQARELLFISPSRRQVLIVSSVVLLLLLMSVILVSDGDWFGFLSDRSNGDNMRVATTESSATRTKLLPKITDRVGTPRYPENVEATKLGENEGVIKKIRSKPNAFPRLPKKKSRISSTRQTTDDMSTTVASVEKQLPPSISDSVLVAPGKQVPQVRLIETDGDTSSVTSLSRNGRVTWRMTKITPSLSRPSIPAVRGDVEILGGQLRLMISIRENFDDMLPASHVIDLRFSNTADFHGKSVIDMPGLVIKQSEQASGQSLAGVTAKISDGFFYLALSSDPKDQQNNAFIMKNGKWWSIPLIYETGERATLLVSATSGDSNIIADFFTSSPVPSDTSST